MILNQFLCAAVNHMDDKMIACSLKKGTFLEFLLEYSFRDLL